MVNVHEPLDFSFNWNKKLGCDYFTTIRMHNPKKYFIGAKKTIFLKKVLHSNTVIIDVATVTLKQLDKKPWLKIQDTGLPPKEFDELIRTMYKKIVKDWNTQKWDVVLMKTTERFSGYEQIHDPKV